MNDGLERHAQADRSCIASEPLGPQIQGLSARTCLNEPALQVNKTECVGGCVQVADVGGGTGFCTQGVVKTVSASNVTIVDQSPHQLQKARAKPDLQGVTVIEVSTLALLCPLHIPVHCLSIGSHHPSVVHQCLTPNQFQR